MLQFYITLFSGINIQLDNNRFDATQGADGVLIRGHNKILVQEGK